MTIKASIRETAVNLYRGGISPSQIAIDLGISRASVRIFARQDGINPIGRVPDNIKLYIVESCKAGVTLKHLAATLPYQIGTISKIARKAGVHFGSVRYDESVKKKALALYATGYGRKDVAKILGVSAGAIQRWTNAAGCSRGYAAAGAVYSDRHPMEWGPLTPERAWLLGVVFGDGGIKADRSEVTITMTYTDEDVLCKIMSIIHHWPKLFRRGGCARLTISSRKFVAILLADYGIDHTKCATMRWPEIPESLTLHFVRGLVDSDGSWHQRIGRQNNQLLFSYGSICNEFVRSLESAVFHGCEVCPHAVYVKTAKTGLIDGRAIKSSPISILDYGHIDAVALGKWIYAGDTEHMRCERKYQYWAERADAYIKPQWLLRHRRHREKLLLSQV